MCWLRQQLLDMPQVQCQNLTCHCIITHLNCLSAANSVTEPCSLAAGSCAHVSAPAADVLLAAVPVVGASRHAIPLFQHDALLQQRSTGQQRSRTTQRDHAKEMGSCAAAQKQELPTTGAQTDQWRENRQVCRHTMREDSYMQVLHHLCPGSRIFVAHNPRSLWHTTMLRQKS